MVPEAHLRKILEITCSVPTAGNQQPWKFLVVRDRKTLDALREASIQRNLEYYKKRGMASDKLEEQKKRLESHYGKIFTAPVFIVVLVDTHSKWSDYNQHDGPLAAANLMLAARALGYGTCYFTDPVTDEVTMKVLEIPDRYQRICITPVGVPEEWPDTPLKKDLSEFIVYDKFEDS
jgi:nitroreductase